jgi:hypothetical protein
MGAPTSGKSVTLGLYGFQVGDQWVSKSTGTISVLEKVGWDDRLESYWFVLRHPGGLVRRITPSSLMDRRRTGDLMCASSAPT